MSLPRGAGPYGDSSHLITQPEEGHQVEASQRGRWGTSEGWAGGRRLQLLQFGVLGTPGIPGTLVGAGRGGQRFGFVFSGRFSTFSVENYLGPFSFFCIKCLPIKIDPVSDSLMYNKNVFLLFFSKLC